jgi:hypothetical protein
MTEFVDVVLESECTDADIAAVAAVFEDAGIPADVRGGYVRESAADLPWLVVIFVGVWATGTFVKAALQGAGDEAGRSSWRALMRLIKAIYDARQASQGSVSIRIADPPAEIPLPPELPDVAYQRLLEIEDPRARLSGILMWDNEAQAWVDALAGKLRCDYPQCPEKATQGRVRHTSNTTSQRREFCDVHAEAADAGDPKAWS